MMGRTLSCSSLGGKGLKAGIPMAIGLAMVTVGVALGIVVGASTVGPETIIGCMVLDILRCKLVSLSIAAWFGRTIDGATGRIMILFCLPRFWNDIRVYKYTFDTAYISKV